MATATALKPSGPKQLPTTARFLADAEAFYSYKGTYQMQHLIVGKAVIGFSAFV